jgi:UTP--glucose-1-phosphate uridylyltransferase
MRVVIPAAGLGTRFLPLTRAIPKELLLLGEWPVIHHALMEAERAGFESAIIVISPAKRAIRTYFEPAPELERELAERGNRDGLERLWAAQSIAQRMKVVFVEAWTRGPGQAVLLSHGLTGEETFAVLLPDDVVPGVAHWRALHAVWRDSGASVLSLRQVNPAEASRFGIAVCEPGGPSLRVRDLVEKPAPGRISSSLRVFGRYIVTRPVLEALQDRLLKTSGELQLTEGYAQVLETPPGVLAVEFSGETYDCGTPSEYAQAVSQYRLAAVDAHAVGVA